MSEAKGGCPCWHCCRGVEEAESEEVSPRWFIELNAEFIGAGLLGVDVVNIDKKLERSDETA